jgi:glycosyltransferase involved in cell wall biosynthesis
MPRRDVPRVSIGLPVYNGAKYLQEALDTWLAQTFDDFELIVCDNASDDDTPRILAEYAERDTRIRVMRRPETVLATENYNGLVPEASAPLFCWSADDDLREPEFLARLVEALDRDGEAVMAWSYTRYFGDARSEARHERRYRTPPGSQRTPTARAIAVLRARDWAITYGLIRTDVLRDTRLFAQGFGSGPEVGLMLELAVRGRLVNVPEPLLAYRIHADSLGHSRDDPIYGGRAGRKLDAAAIEFVRGMPLTPPERRLLLHELSVWCRRGERPRRHLWKLAPFRSGYTHLSRAWIDLQRVLLGI